MTFCASVHAFFDTDNAAGPPESKGTEQAARLVILRIVRSCAEVHLCCVELLRSAASPDRVSLGAYPVMPEGFRPPHRLEKAENTQ